MRWQLLRFPIHPRDGSTRAIEKAGGNAFGGLATSGVHLGKRARHRQSSPARAARTIMSHAFRCVDVRCNRAADDAEQDGHIEPRLKESSSCEGVCCTLRTGAMNDVKTTQ